MRHVDPAIDPEQIRAAVQAVAPTPARQRKLARALTDQPSLLTRDGAHAPASSVLRLIDALAADAGSRRLAHPACPGCERAVALVARRNGLWSSRSASCRPAPPAASGAAVRPPALRDSDGHPICRQCRHRDWDTLPTCIGCQRRRPITARGPTAPDASPATAAPRRVCSICGTTALPARDEQMVRLQQWLAATIAARRDPDQRHLLHRYGDWYLLRWLRERTRRRATGYHQVVAVRQRIRFAVAFLDALHRRGLTLATATQPDLEGWLTSNQATGRHELGAFIRWAAAHQLTTLTMPSTTWAGPGAAIHAQERWEQARRLLHDDALKAADRVAGLLVLLYAQRAANIARLTLDHLDITRHHTDGHHTDGDDTDGAETAHHVVRLRLGREPLVLPAPLDDLVLALAATRRGQAAVGDRGTSPWLFPGGRPGEPVSGYQLGNRLKAVGIRPWPVRNAALFDLATDLATDLPAALLARMLGINIDIAVTWQHATAGDWTSYAADIARRGDSLRHR